jgi:hypothetical protein
MLRCEGEEVVVLERERGRERGRGKERGRGEGETRVVEGCVEVLMNDSHTVYVGGGGGWRGLL